MEEGSETMLREGGKGLSQDAVPGVRLEGGMGEAEQEMLVAVWCASVRVGASGWTQVSRSVPSAEPSSEGLHPDGGGGAPQLGLPFRGSLHPSLQPAVSTLVKM